MGRLRHQLQQIRDADPGTRFTGVYERSHVRSFAMRVTLLVIGTLLIIASAVTFWLPGPNWVLVFLGLAIVCGQSEWVARKLDAGEIGLKRWHDERWVPFRHKQALLSLVALVALVVVGLLAWYAWRHDWIPHSWLPSLD